MLLLSWLSSVQIYCACKTQTWLPKHFVLRSIHWNIPGSESIIWRTKWQHHFWTKSQAHAEIMKPDGNQVPVIQGGTSNNAWSQHLDLAKRWLKPNLFDMILMNTIPLFFIEWSLYFFFFFFYRRCTKPTIATVSCRQPFLTSFWWPHPGMLQP